ncbi:MAG: hypothetical protein EGP82_15625 [Odoribacter splanchnicus]|nr:hypothetical protein [Odoribacter splanchnicus]
MAGEEVEEGFLGGRGGVAFGFGEGFVGVHKFFGVGTGVNELADAADDAAFEFGGGGKGGFFGRFGYFRGGSRGGKGCGVREVVG